MTTFDKKLKKIKKRLDLHFSKCYISSTSREKGFKNPPKICKINKNEKISKKVLTYLFRNDIMILLCMK